METEVVHKRKWITREYFMDMLSATNLVPGPNATEMAIHIGYLRAGWPGLLAGGAAFILPAALISGALAWAYVTYGSLPQAGALFYGINPTIIAIILAATYRLGKSAIKDWKLALLAALCLAASLLGADQAVILVGAGLAGALLYARPQAPRAAMLAFAPGLPITLPFAALAADDRLVGLGLFFLKVGALIFGSGMVLFAFIQQDVVNRLGWLTQRQLVDAIAVGQMTPGPVLSSATFIGYLVSGWSGAVVATVAVFLPSFFITALLGKYLPKMRNWSLGQAFLKGVNAAVVALILAVAIGLARTSVPDV
ncbi:MAG: chromate efflux transporter [Anaerolineae bacterium]|jgi:chromate transporter|nr:chromate efflux transporter [Anaerolineae bacterium]